MKNSVYRIALDMHKDASQYTLHAKRYDTARTIRATFTDGGKPFDVSGFYPVLTGKNAAGETIYESCKIADNSVIYDFTAPLTDLPGVVECEIQLYNQDPKQGGAVMITSARFSVIVSEAVYQEGDPKAEANRGAFTQLLADTTAAMDAANAAAEEVLRRADAGEFDGDPGTPGKKGDKGDTGEPGKTPVAGVDFFTEADKTEMQDSVLSQIGIKQSASGTAFTLRDSADCKLQAFSIDGGTAGEMVSIEVSGKNLINPDNFTTKKKSDGSPMILKGDNWVQFNFTGTHADPYTGDTGTSQVVKKEFLDKLPYLLAGKYMLSFSVNQNEFISVFAIDDEGNKGNDSLVTVQAKNTNKPAFFGKGDFTLEAPTRITIRRTGTKSAATIFYNLLLERGEANTDYEPYRTPQAVTVEATGGKVDVLEQHPDLRSYHHTTVVSNDRDIPMDVTYVADTKTYIDNKLTEVAAALL